MYCCEPETVCFLRRKDPSAFFIFPVTDLIAPGYSAIIKRPMDFSTMKDKVKKESYQSLDELKVSSTLHICMKYVDEVESLGFLLIISENNKEKV